MGCSLCLPFNAFLVFAFPFFLLFYLSSLLSARADQSPDCSARHHFCGKLNISYPFFNLTYSWPYQSCGLEQLRCINGSTAVIYPSDQNDDSTYEVQSIDYTANTILAHDQRFTRQWLSDDDKCNALYNNFTMPPIFRHLLAEVISPNRTLKVCKRHREANNESHGGVHPKDCAVDVVQDVTYGAAGRPNSHPLPYDCKLVHLPVDDVPSSKFQYGPVDPVSQLFTLGFRARWRLPQQCQECDKNGTICAVYPQNNVFCINPMYKWNHGKGEHQITFKMKTTIAIVFSFIFAITLVAILVYYVYNLRRNGLMSFWKKRTRNTQKVDTFLRNYGYLAPKRYSYSNIKKMTNSFKEKVGQGGYGGVFKGKLLDGRLVAVKVLNDSKGDGEDFINEVASISRTSHVNIVTFLGFCFDGSKKALVYEFMSNGSLEKFIYKKKSMRTCPQLGWEKLYQIAVGIAQGLEYLHRGCITPILHFDIKPHNILLDEDFCPKISDFGLAKLCPRKDSIVSMAEARGTIGYIAPEVFSRSFGGVSHKSDVYSYGMMVLEMVGGRRNIDAGVDNTSEIYFPHWIYKFMEQGEHLQLDMVIMRAQDEEIARKMILVGLWCIQVDPSNRPSMSKVMEMLEGNLESLSIPPKPFLSSPPR